ncbi:MAG TPA: DNA alkylation repair protein, partial [Bacteroidales bacterium]|nr:DNA alkylation repair protein [Bacteroidales bacterium]
METLIKKTREELKNNSDERTRLSGERFFKEHVTMYGVKSAVTQRIARENFKLLKDTDKSRVFSLCEELWQSGYLEETFVACNWSYYVHKYYNREDFVIFERWLDRYVNNWASCDTLCNHSAGTLVEMYPDVLSELKRWAKSANRWVKRGAAVSLIIPARKGLFTGDIFEIADILHSDADDMVQKGYGWM